MSDAETSLLIWLQGWFASRTNGDWEHQFGIAIETIDNPGWHVSIDLSETYLASKAFTPIRFENSPLDWVHCRVIDQRFEGYCAIPNLVTVLETFRRWCEES
jgi:Immunity protein 53